VHIVTGKHHSRTTTKSWPTSTGLTVAKWKRARKVIEPLFVINQGVWRIPRLDEQIAHSLEVRETKRRAGRLGGQKSWANRQAHASANATNESKHMLNKSKSKSEVLPVVLPDRSFPAKSDPDFEKNSDSESIINFAASGGHLNG